jgi:membrane protease YdiL (CAAX protease family)
MFVDFFRIYMQISIFTPLFLLAIYGLVAFTRRRKAEEGKLGWTPLESVAVTIFIFFAGQIIGGFLAYVLASLGGGSQQEVLDWLSNATIGQFLFIVLNAAISVGLLVLFLKQRKVSFRTIGFERKPRWIDIAYALIALIAYYVSYIFLVSIIKQMIPSLDIEQEQQIGFDSFTKSQLPLVFISLVVIPPLLEETLTRGFLYTGLRKGSSRYVAVIVTSILFAIAHLQFGSGAPLLWIAAIDTFTLSLFLIYLKEKTGNLWAPILLHGLKNFVAFLALFVFST